MHPLRSIVDIERRFEAVEAVGELMDNKFIRTNKIRSYIFFPIWSEFCRLCM
jgi:hypothetical protein